LLTLFLTTFGMELPTMMIRNIGGDVYGTSFTSQPTADGSGYPTILPGIGELIKPANKEDGPVTRVVHYHRPVSGSLLLH
jgi:hypothetical protein